MILDVTPSSLSQISNPALRSYAEIYVRIYRDFMQQMSAAGLDIEAGDSSAQFASRLAELRGTGATIRNGEKSIYLNRISPSCQACQTGVTSSTFFVSLKCHRDCFYCFNPNQEDYEYYREHTRDTVVDLDSLRASQPGTKHLALTGGEPLLHKPEAIRFFEHAGRQFPAARTRLYTSGDHIDSETLQSLHDAGLDEIRFSIRMHDLAKGRARTFDNIALARQYIPDVMVEMPVLPDTLEEMQAILLRLEELEIFGINLLELCFPLHNPELFRQKGYSIKSRPFRVLYDYWYAGGLPVAGSETVCLALLDFAAQSRLKLGVHYCSLENKHTGQIYQQNSPYAGSPVLYFSQKDYFLKSAKVFGEDIPSVRRTLDKTGCQYRLNDEYGYLEFPVKHIPSLKKLELEIGISSNVMETRGNEEVVRELKLDVTTPQTFRLSSDI